MHCFRGRSPLSTSSSLVCACTWKRFHLLGLRPRYAGHWTCTVNVFSCLAHRLYIVMASLSARKVCLQFEVSCRQFYSRLCSVAEILVGLRWIFHCNTASGHWANWEQDWGSGLHSGLNSRFMFQLPVILLRTQINSALVCWATTAEPENCQLDLLDHMIAWCWESSCLAASNDFTTNGAYIEFRSIYPESGYCYPDVWQPRCLGHKC